MMTSFYGAKRLLGDIIRADRLYGMIEDGDSIAVGLSGGKDSLALACLLRNWQCFSEKHFSLLALTVDMGLEGMDYAPLRDFCEAREIPMLCIETDIASVVFGERKESNPCSLCARMRRGTLIEAANANGCRKLALGHHLDDAVETFMLSLLHEGRFGGFAPVTRLEDRSLTLIRPLVLTRESEISYFARKNGLPVVQNRCPEDHATEREEIRKMLMEQDRRHRGVYHRIFGAMQKENVEGFGGIGT